MQQLIALLVSAYACELEDLFVAGLQVIRQSFGALKFAIEKTKHPDGSLEVKRVGMGRDHYARLTGVKRLVELFTAGRPVPKAPDPPVERKTLSLDEIEQIYRKYTQPTTPKPTTQ